MTAFKIEIAKVRRRADFFLQVAEAMCADPALKGVGFSLSADHAMHLAEAYFLVNDAFKAIRQNDGHRTQPAKIAAISSAVIGTLNPLRPLTSPDGSRAIYVNPLFALRAASLIIDFPVHQQPWDRKMWLCNQMSHEPLECLDEYLVATARKDRAIGDPFDLELSEDELSRIESRFPYYYALTDLASKSAQ